MRIALRLVKPHVWTGGANYILNIGRILRAHEPDVTPVLFAPPDLGEALTRSAEAAIGAPPIILRDREQRDDMAAIVGIGEAASTAAFHEAKIDVVFESSGYYGPRPSLPMLAWLPDFQHRRLPHFFSKAQWWARDVRFRSLLANRQHLLLSSHDAQADMTHFYGSSRAKVHVAPFAICMNTPASFADGERARIAHGLPERFFFLPNQFWMHKNHRVVIDALGLLAPDERPVIAASGSPNDPRSPGLMQSLKDALQANGAADSFRILGHLPYADILALNARADALINPSLFEGWSTTVEEAKALGTPMVLSDLGVHREQVGESALFFDPRDPAACAGALRAAMARPPRQAEDVVVVIERNLAAQRRFAAQLKSAFEATRDSFKR